MFVDDGGLLIQDGYFRVLLMLLRILSRPPQDLGVVFAKYRYRIFCFMFAKYRYCFLWEQEVAKKAESLFATFGRELLSMELLVHALYETTKILCTGLV